MSVRREDGFALPLALSMMVIVAMLAGTAIGFATHNTDRATRDGNAARAFAAADAGIDAALYRMNKALIASQVEGVLGFPSAVLAESKCVTIELGAITVVDPASGWCPAAISEEVVDGGATTAQPWREASYTYRVSTGINIGTASAPLIERRIVAVGTVYDVQKRVLATVHAELGSNGNLLKVFEQVGYKPCEVRPATVTSDPSVGC